jgi:hypothetical protein
MEDQIYIIEHLKEADVCKTHDFEDDSYLNLNFTQDFYYYHKPHNVSHSSLTSEWRLFTCMFGVCKVTLTQTPGFTKEPIEISRENKKQILVGPDVCVHWENISGKAVMHVKIQQQ